MTDSCRCSQPKRPGQVVCLCQSLSVPSNCVRDCRYVQSESAQRQPSRTPVLCVSSSPPGVGFRTDTHDGTGTRRRTGTHSVMDTEVGSLVSLHGSILSQFRLVPFSVGISPVPLRPSSPGLRLGRVTRGNGTRWTWDTA